MYIYVYIAVSNVDLALLFSVHLGVERLLFLYMVILSQNVEDKHHMLTITTSASHSSPTIAQVRNASRLFHPLGVCVCVDGCSKQSLLFGGGLLSVARGFAVLPMSS